MQNKHIKRLLQCNARENYDSKAYSTESVMTWIETWQLISKNKLSVMFVFI